MNKETHSEVVWCLGSLYFVFVQSLPGIPMIIELLDIIHRGLHSIRTSHILTSELRTLHFSDIGKFIQVYPWAFDRKMSQSNILSSLSVSFCWLSTGNYACHLKTRAENCPELPIVFCKGRWDREDWTLCWIRLLQWDIVERPKKNLRYSLSIYVWITTTACGSSLSRVCVTTRSSILSALISVGYGQAILWDGEIPLTKC